MDYKGITSLFIMGLKKKNTRICQKIKKLFLWKLSKNFLTKEKI